MVAGHTEVSSGWRVLHSIDDRSAMLIAKMALPDSGVFFVPHHTAWTFAGIFRAKLLCFILDILMSVCKLHAWLDSINRVCGLREPWSIFASTWALAIIWLKTVRRN